MCGGIDLDISRWEEDGGRPAADPAENTPDAGVRASPVNPDRSLWNQFLDTVVGPAEAATKPEHRFTPGCWCDYCEANRAAFYDWMREQEDRQRVENWVRKTFCGNESTSPLMVAEGERAA